jgi:hypothetical protein
MQRMSEMIAKNGARLWINHDKPQSETIKHVSEHNQWRDASRDALLICRGASPGDQFGCHERRLTSAPAADRMMEAPLI